MTLRTSSSAASLAALVALVALTGCGEGVRISLQLSTAEGGEPAADASGIRTITVLIDNGEINDRESFALNRDEQVLVPPMSVDKTKPFNIEVWACERDTCEQADVILRGCTVTPLDVRNEVTETVVVTIQMYDFRDEVLRQCPSIN